jgi:hypothetical protein
MNKAELKQAIMDSEMPASELSRLVDQLDEPCQYHHNGECTLIDTCHCSEVMEP